MANEWTNEELKAATVGYMWMLKSSEADFTPIKKRVRDALRAGPLAARSDGSLEFRFQNISAVLNQMGKEWLKGYPPHENVGPTNTPIIEEAIKSYLDGPKHIRRVSWLVKALPAQSVSKAIQMLSDGEVFNYPDSKTYSVVLENGTELAPKAVIAYASQLFYGAPLLSEDFVGGVSSFAHGRLRAAGASICMKSPVDAAEFTGAVEEIARAGFEVPPTGCKKPIKSQTTTSSFMRDPAVVAFVETRASGICELCGSSAPFIRSDGKPFLEVHHIVPLSEEGEDTVRNAAALCPNCHRECHYGANAEKIREVLQKRFSDD